jgi:hypothetical protein
MKKTLFNLFPGKAKKAKAIFKLYQPIIYGHITSYLFRKNVVKRATHFFG